MSPIHLWQTVVIGEQICLGEDSDRNLLCSTMPMLKAALKKTDVQW